MALNLLAAAAENGTDKIPNYSTTFVVLLGIGVVFLGLICIIVLCMFISMILNKSKSAPAAPVAPAAAAPVAPAAPVAAQIPNKQAFVAAVSAAIAEELGTDVSALRIISIKQL